jgi:hypothetical protein
MNFTLFKPDRLTVKHFRTTKSVPDKQAARASQRPRCGKATTTIGDPNMPVHSERNTNARQKIPCAAHDFAQHQYWSMI